jgi:hypothetical protein
MISSWQKHVTFRYKQIITTDISSVNAIQTANKTMWHHNDNKLLEEGSTANFRNFLFQVNNNGQWQNLCY